MTSAEVEPLNPEREHSQTDTLDRAATGISLFTNSCLLNEYIMFLLKNMETEIMVCSIARSEN